MKSLGKDWYIQWPFRKPWGKWEEIELELPEKIYNAVVDAMISERRGFKLECVYCKKGLAYVVILRKYENFPAICNECLVGK